MEAVPRARTIRDVEARLSPPQYVYRKERSTEHVLPDLDDYVNRGLLQGWSRHVVSFGVSGAFENAPNKKISEEPEELRVSRHTRGVIREWTGARSFRVKMRTQGGVHYGRACGISTGLPRGRALSPALWLAFITKVCISAVVRRVYFQVILWI